MYTSFYDITYNNKGSPTCIRREQYQNYKYHAKKLYKVHLGYFKTSLVNILTDLAKRMTSFSFLYVCCDDQDIHINNKIYKK